MGWPHGSAARRRVLPGVATGMVGAAWCPAQFEFFLIDTVFEPPVPGVHGTELFLFGSSGEDTLGLRPVDYVRCILPGDELVRLRLRLL